MRTSQKTTRLNIHQRRVWMRVALAACAVLITLVFWLPMSDTFVAAGPTTPAGGAGALPVGTRTLQFGLLPYVKITYSNTRTDGTPPPGQQISMKWEWHVVPLILTALASMFGIVVCLATLPRLVTRRRLPPNQCDECGYDLTGLDTDTERCPECGQQLDRAARRWLQFKSSAIGVALVMTSYKNGGVPRPLGNKRKHSMR